MKSLRFFYCVPDRLVASTMFDTAGSFDVIRFKLFVVPVREKVIAAFAHAPV
jgi:hypothetical protein